MKKNLAILLLCLLAVSAGIAANHAPRPHIDQGLYDQRLPRQLVMVGDANKVVFYSQDDNSEWHWWSMRAPDTIVIDANYIWPREPNDVNSVLYIKESNSGEITLDWGPFDANWIINDGNEFTFPEKTPWCVIFVDANGYPLSEDPNDFTYYQPERAFGIGMDSIAEGRYANNLIEVYSLISFDPNTLSTSLGWGGSHVMTGPNNLRVGYNAGVALDTGNSNTLGGTNAGWLIADANNNTGWGYKVIGGSATGGIGDYPILRTTSNQADPGLPHTTAVSTLEDLENMNDDRDGNYYLTNDINAIDTNDPAYQTWIKKNYDWATGHVGTGWYPIGTPFGAPFFHTSFTGTFDGCGYTISNLSCQTRSGLFGTLSGDAKVANVTVEIITDSTWYGHHSDGGLAGVIDNPTDNILVQNCHTSSNTPMYGSHVTVSENGGLIGTIQGSSDYLVRIYDCSSSVDLDMTSGTSSNTSIGGLLGEVAFVTVHNCFATGDVTGRAGASASAYGGLVGKFGPIAGDDGSKMEYCYSTGTVTAGGSSGGLVGSYYGDNVTDGYIRKCYSTSDVNGTSQVGGLIGVAALACEVTDCYAWGNVTNTTNSGGFIGGVAAGTVISQTYSIGTVSGTGGGHAGADSGGTFNDSYWDTQTSGWATTTGDAVGHTTTWLKTKSNYPVTWDFVNIWYMEGTGDVNNVTALGAYAASNVVQGADSGLYLGAYSGEYNETDPNRFFLDNLDRGDYPGNKEHGLMYGYMDVDPNKQWVVFNFDVNMPLHSLDVNDITVEDITISGLTASRLISTDANKELVSTDMNSWVSGTANQVTVTDDGDGTATLSTPQDIHTGASPTFAGMTITNTINEFSTDGTLAGDSDSAIPTEKAVKTYVDSVEFAPLNLAELSADPAWPTEGKTKIWMSDGTGEGDDGDLMIAAKAGGVTKLGTLWDFSAASVWTENVVYAGENVVYAAEQVVYSP